MADSNSDSESDIDQICMHLGFSDGRRAIRTTVPPAPPENRRHANTSIVAILVVRTRPAPAALLGLIRNVTSPQQYVGVHKVIDLEAGSRGAWRSKADQQGGHQHRHQGQISSHHFAHVHRSISSFLVWSIVFLS